MADINNEIAPQSTPLPSPSRSIIILCHVLFVQASITAKDQLGRQAIHLASQAGCIKSLNFLITKYAVDVNVFTEKSTKTPLHLAAKVLRLFTQRKLQHRFLHLGISTNSDLNKSFKPSMT